MSLMKTTASDECRLNADRINKTWAWKLISWNLEQEITGGTVHNVPSITIHDRLIIKVLSVRLLPA